MLQIGRQGQLYVVEEVTYGTTPALAATDAQRHIEVTMPFDNVNRRTILEKKQSPGTITAARTNQRKIAAFTDRAILRPSGTLNTVPEVGKLLKAGFGSVSNVTLSTTVSVGTGAVGGCTVASATGLAVGDFVLITCPDGKKRLRQILTLPGGGVMTWAPNLPAAPADGAAVKGVITYKLTTQLTLSLSLAHYLKFTDGSAGLKRVISGAVVDKLALAFDSNDDPMITASGPGKAVADAPAQPGGFTTVGGQPPSGIVGETYIDNTVMKVLKLGFEIANGMALRLDSYGYDAAEEAYRSGRREVSVTIDARAEAESTLYDLAEAGTNAAAFKQTGFTEGNCLAVRCPQVEFKVPDTDDPDTEVNWPFKGMALESADAANDEIYLAIG